MPPAHWLGNLLVGTSTHKQKEVRSRNKLTSTELNYDGSGSAGNDLPQISHPFMSTWCQLGETKPQRWMNCMELMAPKKKTVGTFLRWWHDMSWHSKRALRFELPNISGYFWCTCRMLCVVNCDVFALTLQTIKESHQTTSASRKRRVSFQLTTSIALILQRFGQCQIKEEAWQRSHLNLLEKTTLNKYLHIYIWYIYMCVWYIHIIYIYAIYIYIMSTYNGHLGAWSHFCR